MVNASPYSNPFAQAQPQAYYALPVKIVPMQTPPAGTSGYGQTAPPQTPQGGDQSVIPSLLNTINFLMSSLMKVTGGQKQCNKPDSSISDPTGDSSGDNSGDGTGDSSLNTGDPSWPQLATPRRRALLNGKNPFEDPETPREAIKGKTLSPTNPKLVRLNNVRAAQALASIRESYPSQDTYNDDFLNEVINEHQGDNLRHAAEILLGDNNETGARSAMEKLYKGTGSVSIDDVNDFTLRYNPTEITPANASGTPDDKKAATALQTLRTDYKSKQGGWDDDFLRSVVVENSNIDDKATDAAKVLLGFDDNGNARTSWINLLNNGVTDSNSIDAFIKQAQAQST
jgi:hypothetical protein